MIGECSSHNEHAETEPSGNVEMIHKYMANSMTRDSSQMKRIQQAVREAGMFVVLGYSERDGASLYMGQAFISPEGEIVHHRRKIKPTHVERTLWGDGQADSLKCVVDSPFGRIGGLNCWEHLQPWVNLPDVTNFADPCQPAPLL